MTQKLTVIPKDAKDLSDTPPRTALTRMEHVRDEMARVYRVARTGKIDTADASRLTYMLATLAKIIESSDIEARLDNLEVEIKKGTGRGKK